MQVKPHPALAHLVRHYLILDGLSPAGGIHRLFADGNTWMVFNLDNAALSTAGNSSAVNACWLYGQVKSFHDIALTGNINWIVVVLQPYGAYHLWGVSAMEWVDCFFSANTFRFHSSLLPTVLKSTTVTAPSSTDTA